MIVQLRSVETVVVWKLDRLGLSLKDLIELVSTFRDKGSSEKEPWQDWKRLKPEEKKVADLKDSAKNSKAEHVKILYECGKKSVLEIAKGLGISRAT
jgi:DNA invertase Pin-like site-specific DNA recombinase